MKLEFVQQSFSFLAASTYNSLTISGSEFELQSII